MPHGLPILELGAGIIDVRTHYETPEDVAERVRTVRDEL
jgi:hypothetical protein